jgi:hypothetical protein
MATIAEWRWVTVAGLLMVGQTMVDLAPEGPWGASPFTRGLIGLCGLCCLYIGWFRFTFRQSGIIPSINRWRQPEKSWKLVFTFSLACIVLVYAINNSDLKNILPETTGMILLLIASLSMLNAIYVGLVVSGPLSKVTEEE